MDLYQTLAGSTVQAIAIQPYILSRWMAGRPLDEVLTMVRVHRLHGRGIGYVDAQLLASTLLTTDARLWTGDQRLAGIAAELGVATVGS